MTVDADALDPREERRRKYHEADVVVVGAGVCGCALAFALAEQGRSVLLLERWMHEPDRIVGELLQPGGVAALRQLGLGSCLEGIDAVPCYGYHVIYKDDDVVIPYPALDGHGRVRAVVEPRLSAEEYKAAGGKEARSGGAAVDHKEEEKLTAGERTEGRSFHHGRFIMKLRQACQGHANITVVETEAVGLVRGEGSAEVLGVEARTREGPASAGGPQRPDCFFAKLTVVADGYASKFRRQLTAAATPQPLVRSKFYALELLDCGLAPAGFGHVVIGGAFPVLLYRIGSRETRALIDVPVGLPAAAPAAGGVRAYIRDVVLPALPAAARASARAALDALGPDRLPPSMPNSWLPPAAQHRRRAHVPGALLLGDALSMRHPLTGGGMTVALHDALLLAGLLSPDRLPDLADRAGVRAALASFHWSRKRLSAIVNVLAQALYSLFAAGAADPYMQALQRACFAYFRRGLTDEPLGLMGGLLHEPLVLASHFFSVAFLAIWINACQIVGPSPLGLWKLPLVFLDAVLILWRACVVFLPVFWRELQ